MSHGDPSTKDATQKPPDRRGRSFLRTGSAASQVRMRTRWAAFSLAAAVLLCGRRVLADDGVYVHIDSPVPVTLAEYLGHHSARVGRRAMGWSETRYICESPCDRRIHLSSTDQRYVVNGLSFPEAPHVFSLPDLTGALTITVQPGNHRWRTTGFMMALFRGIGIVAPGPPLVILGVLFGEKPVWGAGIGFLAAAGVTAVVGGVLLGVEHHQGQAPEDQRGAGRQRRPGQAAVLDGRVLSERRGCCLSGAAGARRLTKANEALHEANDMSHDDPSTKDATKNLPDGEGSSFVRTGTSPRLARMNARWTAFSLAAAVLLCGRRGLADDDGLIHDGPRVYIDSPVPANLAGYSRRARWYIVQPSFLAAINSGQWLCTAPCGKVMAADDYVITSDYVLGQPFRPFPNSPRFPLPSGNGEVTITVHPGSYGRRTAGFFATLAGVITFSPGASLTAVGSAGGGSVMQKLGIGLMVGGGVIAIAGSVLMATSGTNVKLQRASMGPVGDATPVKPRYWKGEF